MIRGQPNDAGNETNLSLLYLFWFELNNDDVSLGNIASEFTSLTGLTAENTDPNKLLLLRDDNPSSLKAHLTKYNQKGFDLNSVVDTYWAIYKRLISKDASLVHVYADVEATLQELAGSGYTMIAVSNMPQTAAVATLQVKGLSKYFAAVVGGDVIPVSNSNSSSRSTNSMEKSFTFLVPSRLMLCHVTHSHSLAHSLAHSSHLSSLFDCASFMTD